MAQESSESSGRSRSRNPAGHLAPYQFKPGTSGNPGGRPRGRSLTALLRDVLDRTEVDGKPIRGGRTIGHLLMEVLVREGLSGNTAILREILLRIDGPPRSEPEEDTSVPPIDPEVAARMLRAALDGDGDGKGDGRYDPPVD